MPWWHTADDNEVLSVFDLLWYFNHTEVYCIFLTQKRHQHIKTESLQGSLTKRKENGKAVRACKQHRGPTFFESLQGSLEKDILQKHTGTLNMSHPQWNDKTAFIHVTKKYFLVILYRERLHRCWLKSLNKKKWDIIKGCLFDIQMQIPSKLWSSTFACPLIPIFLSVTCVILYFCD